MPSRSGRTTRLPVTDLFFRSLFAFFNTLLHGCKVIHVGVRQSPTDAWSAQQLREAPAYGQGPKYLIRDNDGKCGVTFARVARTSGIEMLKAPITPREPMPSVRGFWAVCGVSASITCSSCMRGNFTASGSAYMSYFNQARPHQGIQQRIPDSAGTSRVTAQAGTKVVAVPIFAGLRHEYRRVA